LLSAALLAGVAPAQSGSGTHAVVVHADKKIGTINPNIYGHFAEHLGHCVEEGIWVGPDSEIPNVRGIRTDVVEALKKIKPPVIRWPGGCFADSYHWQDGIGPREDRPKRINVHWGRVIENNHFGTHEFIDFCRQVGAEPMIAANVGSGTPQEMRDWLEYLNVGADSTLANLRAKNGHPEPFNVRYVCIGNENWGCGGSMDPSHYALLYRQFSEYCHFPPKEGFYRVACGPSSDNYDWSREFFKTMVGKETKGRNRLGRVEAFDMHYYTWGRDYGTATEYRIDEWYGLLAKGLGLEEVALKHWEIMGEYDPGHSVKLAVCEWGVWHHVIPGTNERFLRQQNSMRDALLAALTLDIFNRHCDKISMANIAQTINVLQCMILTCAAPGRRGAPMRCHHHPDCLYRQTRQAEQAAARRRLVLAKGRHTDNQRGKYARRRVGNRGCRFGRRFQGRLQILADPKGRRHPRPQYLRESPGRQARRSLRHRLTDARLCPSARLGKRTDLLDKIISQRQSPAPAGRFKSRISTCVGFWY
jgi:alpha-N-arabinofuranosidase